MNPGIRSSVLVVLVVKDGARWIRPCLRGLARQTHPRLSVLAIDNASTDDSASLLKEALRAGRVIRLTANTGFSGAVNEALQTKAAQRADYVLLLHDDTVLAPEAISRMIETAERIEGAGIVGPKVLDWDHARLLRSIGMSTDRFGYPYSPLEEDEIDQGQYDRIREVLFVSSCAMLVSRDVWRRVGPPDERFATRDEDLDFCWRARMAGFRVVVTPLAEARHRSATSLGERSDAVPGSHFRYHRERSALATMLKNYSVLSLIWILPLYFAMGTARAILFTATRRFEEAAQIPAAWGWNVAHLPGTLNRRMRSQAARGVPDRAVRRFMAPAGDRMRRLGSAVRQALFPPPPSLSEEHEEREVVPFRVNLARFAIAHPVATAWILAAIVAAVAFRNILGASSLAGGALASFPSNPSGFFNELVSGLQHTALGGTQQASPAVGLLGVGSAVSLGSPLLLQKLLLIGLPGVAAASCYRFIRRLGVGTGASVVGAATYAFSPLLLWQVADGRIPGLVFLAGVPWLASKLIGVMATRSKTRAFRWVAGCAAGLGMMMSFYPGAVIAAVLLVGCSLAVPPLRSARIRSVALAIAGLAGAGILAFPVTFALFRGHGTGLADPIGSPSFAGLARLVLAAGPGDWVLAFFLPVGAALSLLFVAGPAIRAAAWAAVLASSSLILAWLAGADRLPGALANPVAFDSLAGFAYAVLIAMGLASVIQGVARHAFGHRQVGGAILVAAVTIGLVGQIAQASRGAWHVGSAQDALPAAYPVVAATPGRVLWLGDWRGGALVAPGGAPQARAEAGPASIRYSVTSGGGASALDFGRPPGGSGYEHLHDALIAILAGRTKHGGALLAPFGITFIVTSPNDVPRAVVQRLSSQIDMDLRPAEGLTLYQVPGAVPRPGATLGLQWLDAARHPSFRAVASLPPATASGSGPAGSVSSARDGSGLILLPQQFDRRWTLRQTPTQARASPFEAFGWAVGFQVDLTSVPVPLFEGQAARDWQVALLGVLWLGALWVIRRPATRG